MMKKPLISKLLITIILINFTCFAVSQSGLVYASNPDEAIKADLQRISAELEKYTAKEGGEIQWMPPKDMTPCPEGEIPDVLPHYGLLLAKLYDECKQFINDPETHEKYLITCSVLLLPYVGIVGFAAKLKSDLADDLSQCMVKGYLDYKGYGHLKGEVDLGYEIKDIKELLEKIKGTKGIKDIKWDLFLSTSRRIKGIDKVKEAVDTGDDLIASIKGIRAIARQRCQEVEGMMNRCEFQEAEETLLNSYDSLRSYCTSVSGHYRWFEKNYRCWDELLNKAINRVKRTDAIRGRPDYIDWVSMGLTYQFNLPSHRSTLKSWGTDLIDTFKVAEEVLQKGEEGNTRKDAFYERKKRYEKLKEEALEALKQDDLMRSCELLIEIKEMEEKERRISYQCAKKLAGLVRGKLFGEYFEESLTKKVKQLEQTIEDYLSKAEGFLKRPCKIDSFTRDASKADLLIDHLVVYKEGKCISSPNSDKLKAKLEKLTTEFQLISENDDTALKLLHEAEQLAQSTCTYDQALTGEHSEEKIHEYVRKGCLEENKVKNRISKIKRVKKMIGQKVELEERLALEHIQKAIQLVDPETPLCQVEQARNEINEATRHYIENLDCSSRNPAPSQDVMDRDDRVRVRLENAENFVETRAADIVNSRQAYEQTLRRMNEKLKDICHFQEAESDHFLNDLRDHATVFCGDGRANSDIRSIKDKVEKIQESIVEIFHQMEVTLKKIEKEEDCDLIEKMIKESEEKTSHLLKCDQYREDIKETIEEMKLILKKKRDEANQKLQDAISKGEIALEQCDNLPYHLNVLVFDKLGVHPNCVDPNYVSQLNSLRRRIKDHLREHDQRQYGVETLIKEAQSTLQTCEWDAFDEQISEARLTLPGEPCFSKNSIFQTLSNRIANLEKLQNSRIKEVETRRVKLSLSIAHLRNYLAARQQDPTWGASRQRGIDENVGVIRDLLGEINAVESQGFGVCLKDLIAQARDLLAQAQEPGPGGDGGDDDEEDDEGDDGEEPDGFTEHGQESSLGGEGQIGMDCSPWPGSVSVYNPQKEQSECVCPSGWAWNQFRTACMDCRTSEMNFYNALQADNVEGAKDLLGHSANCYWHAQGLARLQAYLDEIKQAQHEWEIYCLRLESAIIQACRQHRINDAHGLIQEAQRNKCHIKPSTYNIVQQEIAWQRQQTRNAQRQQAINDLLNNFSERLERFPPFREPEYQPPPRQEPPPRQIFPPIRTSRPPSTGSSIDKSGLKRQIENLYPRWKKLRCQPTRVNCIKGVEEAYYRLLSTLRQAKTDEDLQRIHSRINCYDGCMQKTRKHFKDLFDIRDCCDKCNRRSGRIGNTPSLSTGFGGSE